MTQGIVGQHHVLKKEALDHWMSAASLCIMGDDESGSEEISDTEIDSFILDKDMADEANEFLFAPQAVGENCGLPDFQPFDAETHERLQALLQAAGISKIPNGDGSGFGETDRFQQAADALTKVAAGSELLPTASKAKSNPAKNPLGDKGLNSSSSTQPDSSAEEGESLLSLACSAGYYELAQVLLAMRTNVEDRGVKGDCTPLMEAASAGHVDIVNLLIANGADVNAQSSTGNSPLMYACAGGHEPVVRRLLEAGANLEIHNENGHTALMEAASAGHVSIARLLVQSGASINTHSNEFKESALTLACYKGHLEMVKHLLEAGSQAANKEHRVEEMHTALMEASMDGHVEVAQLLLDNGAQVNMPADSFESPLTLAACGGHTELAKLLIDRGANIEEVNDEGYTPLMEAAREGHEDMVALLLSCESDVNAQTDETGETALTLACCGGFLEVASLLIKAGANCEMGANTPLMEAAQEGHVEVVKFLLKQDCNVNASTATGDTALTYAAENGHTDICASLIDAGVDLEHTAEGGRTALMKSSRAGHLCTVQFLVAKGAQINRSTSANDHTALSLACVGGHSAIVEFLLQRAADPNHKLKDSSTMLIEAAKGGHTTVVQLLLDWPGTVLPSQFPTAQMSVGDMSALQLAKIPLPTGANLIRPEATGVPPYVLAAPGIDSGFVTSALNGNLDPNVLAQYNRIALAASIAATKNVGDVSQDSGDKQSTASPPQYSMVCPVNTPGLTSLSTHPPVAALLPTSYVPAADAMQSVQKAMLRHAGEKLNPLELQQLQEQLRTQFQQAAAVAANMIQQSNTPAAVATDTSDGHGDSHNSSAVASSQSVSMAKIAKFSVTKTAAVAALRCKEAELQAAMKELERLKKTQQIYEELQMAGKELLEKGVGDDKEAEWLQQAQQHLKQQQQKLERQTQQQQKQLSLQQKQQSATPPVPMTPASPSPPPDNTSVVGQSDLTSTGVDVVFPPVTGANATPLNPPTVQWQNLLTAKLPDYPVPPSAQSSNTPLVGFQFVPTSALPLPPVPQSLANSNDGDTSSSAFVSLLQTQLTIPPSEDGTNSVPTELKIELSTEALSSAANSNCGSASFTFQLSPSQGFYFANPSEVTTEVRANLQLIPPSPTGLPSKQEVKKMEPILSVSTSSVPVPVSLVRNDVVTSTTMAHSSVAIQTVDSSYTAACRKPSHLDNVDHPAVARRRPVFSSKKDAVSGGSAPQPLPPVDLNTQTESNHDTALTLACAGGHTELVSLLLTRGADLEHRDKKGFTPLILASTAGHATVVEILLEHGADIEAQSERTKDTALSLACSGGRKEVVEVLLKANANKEHRNVSDYTPLSLAASGGYVEIINLLLNFGAEINSRTGSKLGISPLMLAAMNGHSQAVKVLLERGSDINAQIETNRNTALTLACFQGRHEVVKLLLDYRANVEHRAKTGLTPLMEAANGGYVEVGRVLLQYGADVNASPVPSSKDTALTVAADKGHYKFVELLIQNGALVDVKNKKGNSPLWLASNGGHLDVVQALVRAGADLDSHDNRKVTPLMTAFRKGHVKVVRWMVKHVFQYPSDQDCLRYITTVTDKEAQTKCHECLKIITTAKDRQAEEANKNAKILLLEIEKEAALAETRKLAKLRQKEKKKQKRKAKKDVQLRDDGKEDEEDADEVDGAEEKGESSPKVGDDNNNNPNVVRRCGTPESTEVKGKEKVAKSRVTAELITDSYPGSSNSSRSNSPERRVPAMPVEHVAPQPSLPPITSPGLLTVPKGLDESGDHQQLASPKSPSQPKAKKTYTIVTSVYENSRLSNGSLMVNPLMSPGQPQKTSPRATSSANEEWSSAAPRKSSSRVNSKYQRVAASRVEQKRPDDQADEWKEVKKKANKLTIASQYIARVIGRSGNNINAIRESTGAHIEVEKQQKGQTERTITIRGSSEAMRQALLMINGLVNEQDAHVNDIIQKVRKSPPVATSSSKGSDSGKDVEPVEIKKTPIPPTNGAVLSSKNFPEISVWSSQVTGKSAVAGNRSGAARKQTVSKPKVPESATSVTSTNVTTRTTAAAVVKGQNVWAKRGENGQPLDFASVIKGTGGTNSTGVWKQPHTQAPIPTENPAAPPQERFTASTNAAEKVFSGSLRLAPDFTSAPRSTGKENDQQVNAATEDSVAKERSDVSSTGFNTGGHELPLQVLNQLDQLRNALKLPEFSGGLRSFDPSADDSLSNQFDQIAGVPSHISPVLYNSDSSKPSPHLSNQQYAGYHADGFDALGGYQPASNRNSTAFSDPIESGHPSMNDSSEITTKFFKPISLPRPASATPHLGPKIDHLEDMKPPASSFSPPLDPSAHESGSLARPPGLKPIGMERRNRGPNVSRLATYMQDNNSTSNTDDSQINSWPSQFSATSADLDVDWRMKMLDQSVSQLSMGLAQAQLQQAQNDNVSNLIDYNRASQMADYGSRNAMQQQMTTPSENLLDSSATQFGSNTMSSAFQLQKLLLDLQNQRAADSRRSQQQQQMVNGQQSMQNFMNLRNGPPGFVPLSTANLVPMTEIQSSQPVFQPLMSRPKSFFQVANPQISAGPAFLDPMAPIFTPSLSRGGMIHTTNVVQLPNFVQFANQPNHQTSLQPQLRQLPQNVFVTQLQPHLNGLQSQQQHQSVGGNSVAGVFQNGQPVRFNGVFANPDQLWAPLGQPQNRTMGDSQADQIGGGQSRLDHFDGGQQQQHQMWGNGWSSMSSM